MNVYQFNLSPKAQSLTTSLNGVSYKFTFVWNYTENAWVINIDDQYGIPLIYGILMVSDVDLLAPYSYLGIGGGLVAINDTSSDPIGYSELGVTGQLYFVTL